MSLCVVRAWRAMMRCAAFFLVMLGLGLTGCAIAPDADAGWAAIVIDLHAADTQPQGELTSTLERPWIGFGLIPRPQAGHPSTGSEPSVPEIQTLQIHLRTGTLNEDDPQGEQLEMIEVKDADIGRPRTAEGALPGPLVIALDPPGASLTFTGGQIDWPYARGGAPVVGGMARLTFHPGFVEAAARADANVTARALLHAALMGVHATDLRQYNQLELQPTLPQIIQLVEAGISPATIRGYETVNYRFPVEAFIQLKEAEVSVDDAIQFVKGGFTFDAADLIELRRSEVSPTYAIGLKEAGFADSVELLADLRARGVDPAYAKRMRQLGVAETADKLVLLHDADVSPGTVETFQQAEYDFTAQELITLKTAGVSAEAALALRRAGYDFRCRI